ncbi:MAG: sugar ABC transporter permease [Lachnospiraceae bacterium]|nr:sugar ABC transporter permease [Lachnospiraceae bacterium]
MQKGSLNRIKQTLVTYSFIMPDFIGLLIFIIIPIIYSLYMSLFNWNFANIKEFIGIQNYVTLIQDSAWWKSLLRTFKLTLMYVPTLFVLALIFAVLISYIHNKKNASFIKTAYLLPYSITSVIASCLWMFLYMDRTGYINVFLKSIGLNNQKFLGSTSQAMGCVVIVLIWINLGYNIILFLSAIKDIPESYYEAATLDGANRLQIFTKITFPLLKPTSIFILITSTIASFQCLDLIMVMTKGGPANATQVASIYIYMQSFEMMKAGYGAALSVVMFLIMSVLAILMLKMNGKENY